MDTDEILDEDFDEGSDEADNEFLDPSSTQPSSGPPSTPNSCTSSPPVNSEEPISPHRNFYTSTLTHGGSTLVFSSGKPYGTKRGPGRPRKEFPFGIRTVKEGKFGIKRCRGGITKMSAKKRFLGKDEKNALFNLSQEGFYTMGPKSPSDAHSGDQTPENEKAIQQMEELPYFPERWPGKLCALCNLGERSQLGQGEMLRLEVGDPDSEMQVTPSPSTAEEMELNSNETGNNSSAFPQFSNRRQKGLNKCKNPVNTLEYVDELEKVGHFEIQEFSTIQDANYYYVHRSCATWSFGVLREPTGALEKIAQVVSQSLRRKCSYCNHYGASIACKMSCPKFFHFPCVSASGGFQIIQTYVSFCKEHLGQVPLICADDINCRSCSALGDVSNLVMCSICGDHYHGTCIGLPQLPGVRAGWQCMSCRKCQICRVPDSSEGRSLGCEQCHKVYHANCLRPIMSSIPKFGWKCRRCRVCSDCGSRTPGAGASSRWHAHYTVCDSCYQQRNKGFSCPICHRAYRAAAHREMVKCSLCNKFVHSTCDSEAELSVYHAKKLNNPDYDYVCPPCKSLIQSGRMNQSLMRRNSHLDEDNAMSLQESTCSEEADMDLFEKSSDFGLGKGKPFSATKIAKKRMGLPFGHLGRTKGKLNFQKRPRLAEFGRKRGPKSKMRGIFGVPGLGLQRPTVESYNSKNDEEPGVENRLVLCSAKDKFILTQDICVMCGAIGTDHEGCLISCTQCGQCYHPYCVNVKVTKVILSKGWRCLDCTVCEGCGQKNDESRLILCDECDISFHIYCMDPPLDYVPQGNWKCKWCAVCQKCGRNSPGRNSSWKNSYSECGLCSSQASCAVCTESYADAELIIQCQNCERWLHCKCDSINNEMEAEKCDEQNYSCILCRPKDVPPPHLLPPKKPPVIPSRTPLNPVKTPEDTEVNIFIGMDGTHFMDGVCLSEHGLNLIKSLRMEYIRKKRKQKLPQELQGNNKDAGILAAIESVVAGSAVDQALDDVKIEPLDPKEEAEIYKDGMVWERSDSSPPEGFALCTNEQGVVVLRKKRQRNLQKLGIGGFNVRNRTVKREGGFKDDIDEHGENVVSFVGANDNNLPIEKKRKPLRKKQKSKLIETYPAYLQEAFFGKNLLDTNKTNFESDSSDDDAKSSVSEDKIIKLSPEELKILDSMKQAQKQNVVLPSKESPMNDKNIKSIQPPVHVPSMEEDADNAEADALKDIIPQDLLDSDLVNSIINDSDELSKTNDAVSDNTDISNRKDDLTDILCPSFNLESIGINSKDVEDIFQGVIDTDTKPTPLLNQPHQTIMSPTSTTYSNNSTDLQYVSDSTSIPEPKSIPANLNNFLAVQEVFGNNPTKPMEQNRVPPPSVLNQGYIATNEPQTSTGTNPPLSFGASQVASSWASSSPNQRTVLESSLSGTDEMLGQVPVPQTTCTQKSSERMRKDEELGEMATISAVLYANTNHPELKQEFPNWTDRCKQIYKKWRSLSNEKKAPFLQLARDNRSALRMKKVQQAVDSEKDIDGSSLAGSCSSSMPLDSISDHNDEDSTSRLSSCSSSFDTERSNSELKDCDEVDTSLNKNTFKSKEIEIEKTTQMIQSQAQAQAQSQSQIQSQQVQCSTQTTNTHQNQIQNQSLGNVISLGGKVNIVKTNTFQMLQKSSTVPFKDTAIKKTNLHKFYISPTNMNGPAPNVTVNANGAFNTNSKAVLHTYCAPRPINHFLVMNKNQQKVTLDLSSLNIPIQKDKQVLIKGVINDSQLDDSNRIRLQGSGGPAAASSSNRKILQITSSELMELNAAKKHSPLGSVYLDQNIRVLTPSEIMKTLPILPGQDTTTTSAMVNDCTKNLVSGSIVVDQEKITSQQKSLKEQEQERQWKQLQALRAKEQQLQQFTQVPREVGNPAGNCTPNMSFSGDQSPILEKRNPYASIPGTPRPQFSTDIVQPTVYAGQLETFGSSTQSLTLVDKNRIPKPPQECNKQLRDLLQRQEDVGLHTQNRVLTVPQVQDDSTVRWGPEDPNLANQAQNFAATPFREPFPVTGTNRSTNSVNNPSTLRIATFNPGMPNVPRLPFVMNKAPIDSGKRMKKRKDLPTEQESDTMKAGNGTDKSDGVKQKQVIPKTEIPEIVTAELEKLEQEENVVIGEVEGVGDILGGLGEDDDDELLNSLTAEMGADFNILEYADPELDALTEGDNHNLLDGLDFDEGDAEEKMKKSAAENKFAIQRTENPQIPQQMQTNQMIPEGAILKNRNEFLQRKDPSLETQQSHDNRQGFVVNQPTFGTMNRVMNVEAMPQNKPTQALDPSQYRQQNVRYNPMLPQGTVCKISRANLPPPPPPYPGPPPPYPANSKNVRHHQEQPLLLEDLLEQEKREQQQQQQQQMITQSIDKKTITTTTSGGFIKTENLARGGTMAVTNWRGNTVMEMDAKVKKEMVNPPLFNANLQPPPPLPPENIITEQDRILQINYEQWLNNQNMVLTNQLKFYEEEVAKLRKIRKSLNSKQRLMKKTGGELSPQDAIEFTKVSSEQAIIQKHLENSRKQCRQHALLLQDYKSKHLSKLQMSSPNIQSPAQINPLSPMLSPSTNSQPSLLMQTSPSPLGSHMLQSTRSPLQSPSPLLAQSPGGISQSPVHQSNSSASPYHTMQSSPRIGTPHSQHDENSFSPSATVPSPSSLPARHASPAPRITSPQHRISSSQLPQRVATSPINSYNPMMSSQQQSKFNSPQVHQDRSRMQMGNQQHLHQTISPLGSPQPIVSPNQVHSYGHNPDLMQTQRTMHFIQQRQQIIQRQQANQNVLNQAMAKAKNHPASSPVHNQSNIPSPSSPLLQYNPQQNNSILVNTLSNKRGSLDSGMIENYAMLNSSPDQYLNQCRDNSNISSSESQVFSRSNSDSGVGGGGGLSSMSGNFLPITSHFGRFGRIKLGLFGGSPMWNISSVQKRVSDASCSDITKPRSCSTNDLIKEKDLTPKSKPPEVLLSSDAPKGEDGLGSSVEVNEVVVIDSSPDEKQGIIDYDDYQDKAFIAPEVSLNSAAQNLADGDDMTVIEKFAPSELADIVSSPLESEVAEEYVLFSTDVVDYVDSDDSLKQNSILQKSDDLKCDSSLEESMSSKSETTSKSDEKSESRDVVITSTDLKSQKLDMMETKSSGTGKPGEGKNFATTEDFEAMIDRRSTPKEDESSSPTPTPVSISVSVAGPIATTATVAKTVLPASSIVATGLICNRIPLTSVCGMLTGSGSSTTTAPTTVVMTSKKIVTDVTQTTAKVSIGNTTISVPLLKTMTLNSSHIISSEKQAQGAGNVSIQKQPTILNVRGQKLNPGTIVSLSSLQLKPSANTKIVQATVVGKKLHIPQTTSDNLNSIKQNLMHTFSYPKLSSLTVLQDMALPNKIFEDESISPESSVEQEDTEMKPIDIKEATSSKKESMADDEKSTDATDGPSPSSAAGTSVAKQVEKADEKKKEEQPASKSDTSQEMQKISTRIIPIMPQLSPLSQPTEMTTNMANVSQQLRSIMSSINSASITVEQQKTTGTQDDKQVGKSAAELKVEVQQAPKAEDKETKPSQAEVIATSTLTQTMVSRPTSANTVKVFLTTSSSNTSQFAGTLNCDDNKTLITPKTKVVVPTSMFSSVLPSTIVMTSIPHVPAKLSENSLNNSGGNSCSSKDSFKQIIPAQVSISHLKRSKSTDDGIERELPAQITGAKRYSLEVAPVKIESPDNTEDTILSTYQMAAPTTSTESFSATSSINKQSPAADQSLNGCKTSTVTMQQPKSDESQNVLLKQLLQNSGTSTATVASSSAIQGRKVPGLRAPSLGVVSSLEAQLARPVIPPVPTNTPSLLQAPTQSPKLPTPPEPPSKPAESEEPIKKTVHIVARETSFISNPAAKSASSPADEKPPSAMEKPSNHTSISNQDGIQMRQIFREEMKTLDTIKVENLLAPKREITESPTASSNPPIIFIDDKKFVKKEICESPPIKRSSSGTPVCNNYDNSDMSESKDDKIKVDSYESNVEIKKKKKREYQKNRRQMQMLNKEVVTHTKKRPRKLSKLDEDYDNFIDNLMVQLRQMPPLQVLEPLLSRNYGICPPYGAGDLSKLGYAKENSPSSDFLEGEYGCAKSSNHIDYYNTKPFGDLEMPLEPHSTPMHNGFYDQEFPPIKFETETDQLHRFDSILKDRDIDTPESIVTSSSPECVLWDSVKPFPGLRVINEDMNDDCMYDRMSPVVPVIAPTPIKLQSGIDLSLDKKPYDNNKENTIFAQWKNKNGQTQPAKDSNVTVTLTLTSSAAEDIMGVLRDLANILHIPPPTSYQIVERTTTPPSQKLGLYRTKGKDGKEGDPIDIQTILNGAAKFCRHCDVVILNTIIRAKACEFPLLTSNNDLINNSDELYFCSKSCYKQFKWRPTNIIDDNSTSNMDFTSNSSMDSLSKFDTSSGSVGQSNKTIKQETSYDNNNLKRSQSLVEEASHRIKLNKSISMQSGCGAAGGDQQNVKKSMSDSFKPNEFINKRYKYFSHNAFTSPYKYKKPSEKEVNEMLFRMNITVTPISKVPEDTRRCIFCSQSGDGVADGPSRLLNFDVDKWVHLNCALWSDGVYETVNGALMNLEAALQASLNQSCTLCHRLGATIKCFKNRCGNMYHLSCAIKDKCIFYKDKTTHCLAHALKNEKESELTTLSVQRRVYVDRDESRQVAAVMHHSESSNLLRVGSLIFLNVGQLLSHQLQAFHTPNYIYPIGYKIIRFYWSMRRPNKRCRYICSIADVCGRPEFRVLVQEPSEDDIELRDSTPKAVWQRILEPMALLRKNHELVQLFPKYVTGEDIFGLTEPAVVRILESLPGIETLTDYRFKYGRNPLLELPLAINPSGAARTEPKQKQAVGWRKPHTQRSGSTNQRLPLTPTTSITGEVTCPYSKQFVHSKSSQYKKMKQEWRNNVFLARSKIQGLGLYAARDLEKHTMVIEYIGEVIRVEVSELREKQYEARNRGIYMFRLDEERVVDATLSGGLARYINHSCNPNCVTEIVEVDREYRIIIFAKRRIIRGEELSYDYKFDIEDDAHKISCMCGAPNCRKWMN